MRRTLFTLVAFTALAAWAGAQGPPPPLPAAVQVKQFKANRILIENLVDHGIDIANADNPLRRAEECRKIMRKLSAGIAKPLTRVTRTPRMASP